jgi:hypothetical protein
LAPASGRTRTLTITLPFPSGGFDEWLSLPASAELSRPRGPSPFSSKVVADVEYESCADELRLWGGDGRLNKPSEPRAPGPLDIDLLSPLPFNRLGVALLTKLVLGLLAVLGLFRSLGVGPRGLSSADSLLLAEVLPGAIPPDKGLGGRLAVRMPPRGGCGKALMLIVFLIVFPALFTPGVVRDLGRVELPPGVVGGGSCDVEGARSPLFGRLGVEAPDLKSDTVGIPPVLFRVFVVGNAGKAEVGGPHEGLEGRGRDAAIVDNFRRIELQMLAEQRCFQLSLDALYQDVETLTSMKVALRNPRYLNGLWRMGIIKARAKPQELFQITTTMVQRERSQNKCIRRNRDM